MKKLQKYWEVVVVLYVLVNVIGVISWWDSSSLSRIAFGKADVDNDCVVNVDESIGVWRVLGYSGDQVLESYLALDTEGAKGILSHDRSDQAHRALLEAAEHESKYNSSVLRRAIWNLAKRDKQGKISLEEAGRLLKIAYGEDFRGHNGDGRLTILGDVDPNVTRGLVKVFFAGWRFHHGSELDQYVRQKK